MISKLKPGHYQRLMPMFHDKDTNLSASLGVVDGSLPGQIWVDNEKSPTSCLIMCQDDFCFIKGLLTKQTFHEFLYLLKQKKDVRLQCDADIEENPIQWERHGFITIPRREYRYTNDIVNIPILNNVSPYTIKPILSPELLQTCLWKDVVLEIYGSKTCYLNHAFGFILWDDDKKLVVSEAHAVGSKDYMELITKTNEAYLGKNLSTIICNHLIHQLIKSGVSPVWSCNEENIASWKVANKQGFDELIFYNFYKL